MRRTSITLLLALAAVFLTSSDAVACPMCKLALESDDPQPRAYMFSILFLLIMIGTMFSLVTVLLIWLSRREKLVLEAAGYQHLFENGVSQLQVAQSDPQK